MENETERTQDSQAAEEIRRLRKLIVGLVVSALLVGGFWFWYHQHQQAAADCGRKVVDAVMRDLPEPDC